MTDTSMSRAPVDRADVHLSDVMRLRTDLLLRQSSRTVRDARVDSARLAGTLRDLAEARARVVLRSTTGRVHRGVLTVVGVDHVRLELEAGWLVVAMSAIQGVQPVPGSRVVPATGDPGAVGGASREPAGQSASANPDRDDPAGDPEVADDDHAELDPNEWTLADALDDLSYDRATVELVPHGPGSAFRGELIGVGDDVVTVEASYAAVYVPIASVAEVALVEDLEYSW